MNKTVKTGRKRKYTTEQLSSIIESYLSEKSFVIKIKYTDLEEFAKSKMGYDDIIYQDFRRNPDIKNMINEFNNVNSMVDIKSNTASNQYVKFHVDEFLDRYKNDTKTQAVILHKFNKKYEEVCSELIKKNIQLEKMEAKYKKKINLLENENSSLKEKNKQLSKSNRDILSKNARLSRVEKFLLSVDIYEDLIKRKIAQPMDEENLRLLLLNAGLLKTNDIINISDTEVISSIDSQGNSIETSEDTVIENSEQKPNNLIDFFEKEF